MVRPRRGRAFLVGAADYRPNYVPQDDLRVTDIWPAPHTLSRYRLTLAKYRSMYEGQAGRCAICGIEKDPLGLVIDHNHDTGKVRGLLCLPCNVGIGHLKDSPDVLEAAIQYLEERGCYGPNALAEETA